MKTNILGVFLAVGTLFSTAALADEVFVPGKTGAQPKQPRTVYQIPAEFLPVTAKDAAGLEKIAKSLKDPVQAKRYRDAERAP